MKKVLLTLAAILTVASMSAQTIFFEGFESGIPSTWTTIDNDGDGQNWNQYSYVPYEGSYSAASASWTQSAGALSPDNWLITPAITVPSTGYSLNWFDAAQDPDYPADKYSVYIATGNTVSDFTATTAVFSVTLSTDAWTGRMVSLDAYAGQTIYVAFRHHDSYDNFMMKLDNVKVFQPVDNEVRMDVVELPTYSPINNSLSISGSFTSFGVQPLTTLDVQYIVNGTDTSAVCTVNGLNVAYGGTGNFTHTAPYTATTAGVYNVQVIISNPNGVADDATDNTATGSFIGYDASLTVDRTIMMEQFTGAACGYCPAGHDRIEQAISGRNDYIWMVHHAGYGTDGLSNSSSSALTFFYNASSTYAPAIMYDRTHFDMEEPGPVMGVGNVSDIIAVLNEASAVPCFLTMDASSVTFDEGARAVSGTITGHFTSPVYGSNTRIAVYLVEDSIWMKQADYYNGQAGNSYQIDYLHMNTARGTLTDKWGDPINVSADGNFTYTVNYTLPATHKAWRCRLVAVVYNYDAADANNCAVFNGVKSANFPATYVGIDEVSTEVSLNVYPNPASDFVVINANNTIREINVVNALGQNIYRNGRVDAENITINTENFAAGMYIVTVKTDNGISTKRVSVVK